MVLRGVLGRFWWSDVGWYLKVYEHLLELIFGTLRHKRSGGDERNRTADLLIANQTLSQLSYTPIWLEKVVAAW